MDEPREVQPEELEEPARAAVAEVLLAGLTSLPPAPEGQRWEPLVLRVGDDLVVSWELAPVTPRND